MQRNRMPTVMGIYRDTLGLVEKQNQEIRNIYSNISIKK